MSWLTEVFGTEKPIIGMCHLGALPGDPLYDCVAGVKSVVRAARRDLRSLQEGGVDAVMFSNEASRPYVTDVSKAVVASMARVIGELLADVEVALGVDVLWDASAALDLAVAVDAQFVREIFTGVYSSDFGLWDTNCGATVRHQHAIGAENVRLLFNIYPESAMYLARRPLSEIAVSTVFNAMPDAVCVSGLTAGAITDSELLAQVKNVLPSTVLLANTGIDPGNVETQLAIADGAIVGTYFKEGGTIWNPVDVNRVRELMTVVRALRA